MTAEISVTRAPRVPTIASIGLSLLLTAPGFLVGLAGTLDGAPSAPQGVAGIAELLGFLFCGWVVYVSIKILITRFVSDILHQFEYLIASLALSYGFYLLMTVIGLEASVEHKQAFTYPLQPLGLLSLALVAIRMVRSIQRR